MPTDLVAAKAFTMKQAFRKLIVDLPQAWVSKSANKNTEAWFRFLVKNVSQKAYSWDEMFFFTYWKPPEMTIALCFNTPIAPVNLEELVQATLDSPQDGYWMHDPYSVHLFIINAILVLYDKSVWAIRDRVRSTEKVS